MTTVGYGTISPDAWGGDAGYCEKPSDRATYIALREQRVALFIQLFELFMWKTEA